MKTSIEIPHREPCPFCRNIQGENKCAFVHQGRDASSFVNPRQYERGALLVIPNRHVTTVVELKEGEMSALYRHVQRVAKALCKTYEVTGLNIYQNNGVVAGQTVPHVHVHVVPRYKESERGKIFTEKDFAQATFEVRLQLADEIRQHLDTEK